MSGYIVYEAKSANDKNQLNKADSGYTPTVTHIFLPAAGIYFDGNSNVYDQGFDGYYWSTGFARYLYFYDGGRRMYRISPDYGMAVRPVSE